MWGLKAVRRGGRLVSQQIQNMRPKDNKAYDDGASGGDEHGPRGDILGFAS